MDCGVPTPFAIFETLSKSGLAGIAAFAGSGAEVDRAFLVSHYLNEYLVPGRFVTLPLSVYGLGILVCKVLRQDSTTTRCFLFILWHNGW